MKADDIELCQIYGQIAREYLGGMTWNECEPRLRECWARVRRDPQLEWRDVAAVVRTYWELAAAEAGDF